MRQVTRSALQKICATCGRQISWRKKWEKNWDAIAYCSDSCRKNKIRPGSLDTAFECKILSLLDERRAIQGASASVTCDEAEEEALKEKKNLQSGEIDSEKVIELSPEAQNGVPQPSKTRERCRQAARRLAARGKIVITQDGKAVDPSFARGVMELKLPS